MKQTKKKLFVSFSTLLVQLREKQVNPQDLQDALFYFGCERVHLLEDLHDNSDVVSAFRIGTKGENLEGAVRAYSNVQAAVLNAENQGRAVFIRKGGRNSYSQLNRLLEKNRINTTSVKNLERDSHYNLPIVRDRYKEIVQVMWD